MLLTDPGVSLSTTMVATGTEDDSHPEAGTVKDAGNNGGGRGTQKAEKTGKELENAKEKQQQLPPVVASSSSIDALALTASPSTTKPTVHCLFCQAKLELHPSLVTEGGEIAPLSNEIPASEPSSTGLANLAEPCSSDIQSFIADLQLNQDPENSNIASSSSLLTPMSPNQNGNMNLLELIGQSNSPLDVPMCKKCATSVATELQQQLADLERECRQYKQALDQQLKHRLDSPFDQDLARRKLETLKTEERDLQDQLAFLEEEERTLNRELDVKMEERRRISEQDEQLYRQLRDNHRTLIEQADEQRALKLQIRHAEEQIKQLSRTNVLDMCFHIWVDGEFGTISGFRLGRLRHEPIEWNEINAALGQMAFLLKVISERLGMEFIGAELVPCGNCSFIRVQKVYSQQQLSSSSSNGNSRVEEWPLYGSGGWRPFGQPGLDKALVAFMDCFLQIEHCLKQYFPAGTQLLPYRMLKDKIVDKDSQYLIKMQLNSEERWTKAMKCLLLNLKRVIGILSTLPSLTAQPHQQSQSPRSTTTPIGGESAAGKGSSSSSSPSISIKSIGMAEKQLQK